MLQKLKKRCFQKANGRNTRSPRSVALNRGRIVPLVGENEILGAIKLIQIISGEIKEMMLTFF